VQRRSLNGYLLSLLAALSWSGTAPGIGYLLREGLPRLSIALWRDVFVALAIFAVLGLFKRDWLRVPHGSWGGLLASGVIAIGIYHALWVYSVAWNGAAVAVVLVYTYNVFVTFGAWLFFREAIRPAHIAALVLSLLGLVLVMRLYDPALWSVSLPGAAIGVISAVAQAVYVLLNQRAVRDVNPLGGLGYQMLFGALTLAVVVALVDPPQLTAVQRPEHWAMLIFLSLGPTLGGYGFFNAALKFVPGKQAGLISTLEAVFSAVIAYFLLGESLVPVQVGGMLLVLAATVLPNLDQATGN
jgi:drug/metabolite transporter, DME family